MMYEKKNRYTLPQTVDEVADLLISDLTPDQQATMAQLDLDGFKRVYAGVAQYLIEEFRLWTGNSALLDSCFQTAADPADMDDPAMVILKRIWEKLRAPEGIIIIT